MSNPSRPSSSPSVAPSIADVLKVRATLDAFDAALGDALSDPRVFEHRRAVGRVVGALCESFDRCVVTSITARTFPPYGENGALTEPPAAPSSSERAPTAGPGSDLGGCGKRFGDGCQTIALSGYGDAHECCGHRGHAGNCRCWCAALASSPVVPEPVEATYDERALWCSCGVFLPDVTDGIAMHKELCPRFEYASVKRVMADQRARINAAQSAINKACAIIELGDERWLRGDGPAGGQPPDLSLSEWRELYVTLDAARSSSPVTPATSDAPSFRVVYDAMIAVQNAILDSATGRYTLDAKGLAWLKRVSYDLSTEHERLLQLRAARSTPTGASNGE